MKLISQSRLPVAYTLRQRLVCLAVIKKARCGQNVGQKPRCLNIKQRIFRGLLSCRHAICVQGVFCLAFFARFPISVFATHIVLRFKVRSNPSLNPVRFAHWTPRDKAAGRRLALRYVPRVGGTLNQLTNK